MKICVSSYSLNKEFGTDGIDMFEFIRMVKEDFGADAMEMMPMSIEQDKPKQDMFGEIDFEKLSPEEMHDLFESYGKEMRRKAAIRPSNLDEIKAALDKYGVQVMNMPLDFGNISEVDDEKRIEDIKLLKNWIDIASYIGSKSVRVNTGFMGTDIDKIHIPVSAYIELAEYGATKGVCVALENHGGISADPKNIVKLFEMVNNSNFRICPDFGNFEEDIRYDALDMIFKLNPILVHAKTHEFDSEGNNTSYNFDKCMEIARKHNYNGYYSVEFEGSGDQYEGITKTIALLKRYA